jgi:hypothetical protein
MGQTTDVVTRRLGPPETSTPIWDLGGNITPNSLWYYEHVIEEGGETRRALLTITSGRVVKVDVFIYAEATPVFPARCS